MTKWTWLTEPLALDAANTRSWADGSNIEFLTDPSDLSAWLAQVRPRLPRHHLALSEAFDHDDLVNFRGLRDLLIEVFAPLSEGRTTPPRALSRLTNVCLAHPMVQILDENGVGWQAPTNDGSVGQLMGLVAAETVSIVSEAADRIAVCHAPNCHWLFLRGRPNQRWCHAECGNRARVSRHHDRQAPPKRSAEGN